MHAIFFIILSATLGLLTVFGLNCMLKWKYFGDSGIISYVLALVLSLIISGAGLIGEQPTDGKTKVFLLCWLVILIITIYMLLWLTHETLIGPILPA